MKIQGAVLEEIGRGGPYAQSRPITISEVDLDPPGPGEILVKMDAAGLCHSDLSVVNGVRPRPVPMLLGHESAGTVVELGEGVDDLKLGDRVVMTFLPRCGKCAGCATEGKLPCEVGSKANGAGTLLGGGLRLHRDGEVIWHHLGVSGFATHAVVNRLSVVPIARDVPPEVAAVLGCAVLTGGGAVINAGHPEEGQDVIVVGLGGVGMAAILTAVALGKGKVIGVDALESKLPLATKLGAHEVYTTREAQEAHVRAPIVIEAAGHAVAFEVAVELSSPGGTTITVGLPRPDARSAISPTLLTGEARTLMGSYLGSAVPSRDIPAYVAMWRDGRLPVEQLISSTIRLEDINFAMDELEQGTALRQIILFDEEAKR
jgi:alcohol dehydrogenase